MTFTLTDASPTSDTRMADCPCGVRFVQRKYTLGPLSASVWGLDVVWLPLRCAPCDGERTPQRMGIVEDAV